MSDNNPTLREDVRPSEAVYAFASWLTTRQNPITIGSSYDASKMVDLVRMFVSGQRWQEPRDDYTNRIRSYPLEEETASTRDQESTIPSALRIRFEEEVRKLNSGRLHEPSFSLHQNTANGVFESYSDACTQMMFNGFMLYHNLRSLAEIERLDRATLTTQGADHG